MSLTGALAQATLLFIAVDWEHSLLKATGAAVRKASAGLHLSCGRHTNIWARAVRLCYCS